MARKKSAPVEPASPPDAADEPAAPATAAPESPPPVPAFTIVGIGASAGGLEAFEQFFRAATPDSGMAFILVPHLDPNHASILTEIIQRNTSMPVVEASDHLQVAPNTVYVIPPNRDMGILRGALQLSVPEQPRGQRMPIDAFLRSLAEDQGENAIGIVLSGTGSDGTLGLRAILGAGGICLVQEPASAKYDGMPTSAIGAGYATHILSPEAMPALLLGLSRHRFRHPVSPLPSPDALSGINQILMHLRSATGHDFSQYKKSTISRRIERRMTQHAIDSTKVYARYIKEHPAEVQALFRELLINVTSFFRDPEAFATLKQEILTRLLADKPADYTFRVWVAGCASGEEAYSIAMVLRELVEENRLDIKIQIYATDLDDEAIAIARSGGYPLNIAQDLTPERLRRFFAKSDNDYKVKKEIRDMVVFAVQNVIKDPPFTKLDLLSCRNLMIYLEPELQNRLIPNFHYALKPDGILMLSSSESITSHPELFAALNRKWKLYRALHSLASTRTVIAGGLTWAADKSGREPEAASDIKLRSINLADLCNRALMQAYAPASVVTDLQGRILYVHGETGRYLRPAPGLTSTNIIEMAREGLQLPLRSAVTRAANEAAPTLAREVSVKTNGDYSRIGLSVRLLPGADPSQNLLLASFQDLPPLAAEGARRSKHASKPEEQGRVQELERELAYSRENLQAIIEEQQASNDELKSTNEELQSTNEELQSTNEELETSKEELQSLNEEMVTVNAELESKIEQLADMQNDMKNLLDNVNTGTIFLDPRMNIRRFTREAVRVYRLMPGDIGRPLSDIRSSLEGPDLLADAQTVLDTLTPVERQLRTVDGTWYLVRVQPYRTLDNAIDGVVLTFNDISQRVAAEAAALGGREVATGITDTATEALLVLDDGLQVLAASRAFYAQFHTTPQATLGHRIYQLGEGEWNIPGLRDLLETILPRDQVVEAYTLEHEFSAIGRRRIVINARRMIGRQGNAELILLALEAAPG